MSKLISNFFRKIGYFKSIQSIWITLSILFCILFIFLWVRIGEGEENISIEARELIKIVSSGDYLKISSAFESFEEYITQLINFGKKQQAVNELKYVNANLAKVEKKNLIFENFFEESSALEYLLTDDKNVKEIDLISTAASIKRNVQFAVSPETSKDYNSLSQSFVASATREKHPIRGVGCGEIYRYLENGDLNYIGKLPLITALPNGPNRIRIYFGRLYYDIDLNFTYDSVSITSFSFGKEGGICTEYGWEVESQLKQLSKVMSGKSWTYKDNTTSIYIPCIYEVTDHCQYCLNFGSQKYYRIRLSSEPLGAKVSIDGKEYGETCLEILIRRNFGMFRLVFKKDGYFDAVYEYQASENNLTFNAILKPVK
ncbi:MAG TPA: PEGA domain-containing protein [Candidatus Deferrimicrobium sp.]|nr:PEGA domain-containing protein [Candidatus Deferrimicrobium sp.]